MFYFEGNCDAESQRHLQFEYGVNTLNSVRVGEKHSLARPTACRRLEAICSKIQRGPYFRYAVFLPPDISALLSAFIM
jgi:hypothetical protein